MPESEVILSGVVRILLKLRVICACDFPHHFANNSTINIVILSVGDTDELGLELMEESDVSCLLLCMGVIFHRMPRERQNFTLELWLYQRLIKIK